MGTKEDFVQPSHISYSHVENPKYVRLAIHSLFFLSPNMCGWQVTLSSSLLFFFWQRITRSS